jgi:hypothetical protein
MGARVHWDARREKWFVRVYDAGRQHKQYVGTDRDEARAVADLINADLERVNQERDSRGIVFRSGGPVNGEDALRWWHATLPVIKIRPPSRFCTHGWRLICGQGQGGENPSIPRRTKSENRQVRPTGNPIVEWLDDLRWDADLRMRKPTFRIYPD